MEAPSKTSKFFQKCSIFFQKCATSGPNSTFLEEFYVFGTETDNISCNPPTSVSYADKEILHCIAKRLADEDIRRQVLGVVEEMNLDATVKFIEAKESGKKAGMFLDNGEVPLNKITGYR